MTLIRLLAIPPLLWWFTPYGWSRITGPLTPPACQVQRAEGQALARQYVTWEGRPLMWLSHCWTDAR